MAVKAGLVRRFFEGHIPAADALGVYGPWTQLAHQAPRTVLVTRRVLPAPAQLPPALVKSRLVPGNTEAAIIGGVRPQERLDVRVGESLGQRLAQRTSGQVPGEVLLGADTRLQ